MTRKTEHMHAIDIHVGMHVKQERISCGMSQQVLAKKIGVSYQQMHKYETGANSISAGRLAEIARALSVPPSRFFEGLEEGLLFADETVDKKLQLQFIKHYSKISNPRHRDALQLLIRVLSEEDKSPL